MARLFVALNFPHPVCDQMAREAKSLARIDPLADFANATNLHITLAFIGEAPEELGVRLNAALAPLCSITPRMIQTGYLNVWPKPGILQVGISPRESLDELARAVRREIRNVGLTYDPRPFTPHITLARRWRRHLNNPVFKTFDLQLTRPVVMVSERDPRTKAVRYRQLF